MDYILTLLLQNKCIYCQTELNKNNWVSQWGGHAHHHYKIIPCDKCTRKNWVRLEVPGSGHDFTLKRDFSPLESAVRKVWEK